MQLHKAEEELGVQIFDRNKKPILPTDAGKPIIEQAQQILREHERLLHISRDHTRELSGDFHLGVIPTLAPYAVPLFIEKFSTAHPALRLTIDEMKTEDIIAALKSDTLDAGLLATPLHEKAIDEFPVFYEPFLFYAATTHPLLEKKFIREGSLEADDIWLLRDGHCLRNQVINYCSLQKKKKSVYSNVTFEGGTLETLRLLIRRNKRGCTLLPQLFVDGLPPAEIASSVRPFAAPIPTREVSLVMRRGHWKVAMVHALADTLKRALPKELLEKAEKQVILEI